MHITDRADSLDYRLTCARMGLEVALGRGDSPDSIASRERRVAELEGALAFEPHMAADWSAEETES